MPFVQFPRATHVVAVAEVIVLVVVTVVVVVVEVRLLVGREEVDEAVGAGQRLEKRSRAPCRSFAAQDVFAHAMARGMKLLLWQIP